MKRPILYWVILFILGEVFSRIISISVVCSIGSVLLLFFAIRNRRLGKRNAIYLIGIVFFFLGVFCMHSWQEMLAVCELPDRENIVFRGTVIKKEENTYGVTYVMKVTQLNEISTNMCAQLELQQKEDLLLGAQIQGKGMIKEFLGATNPGGYDAASYQLGNGILFAVENVTLENVSQPTVQWREYLYQFRCRVSAVFLKLLDETDASLATAMVLGDKTDLDTQIKELYQKNGIAHLIAISGLHIAMIGGSLYRILRRIMGSYPIAAVVGILFIVAYGVMTGLSGATVRAVIMLITSIGADVFGRRYDGLSAIALALWLMLVSNPYQITQVGFQLSFGAVIGIAIIQPIWKIYFQKIPKILDGLCVSISVQLILTPIMLYYFYEVPIYSILLNVIVVPAMNWLLGALLLCGCIGLFSVEVAQIPAWVANGIFAFYENVCKLCELLPGHTLCTGKVEPIWIALYYLLLSIVVWLLYQKKKRNGLIVGVLWVMLFAFFFVPTQLTVCMFDVGQGDSIYIRTPRRTHILVDGGSSTKKNVGKYVLKNGLKYYGAATLDYVFLSHSDSDHYSGVKELLETDWINIRCVVFPAITNPDDSYAELVSLAKKKGCRLYYMKKEDVLRVDGVQFQCLGPIQKEYEDKNAGSIVLQMNYRNFDMLLTGDLTKEEEKNMAESIDGQIEVLKVAHHGSATSTSASFLQVVKPIVACISVGENNRYGHPAKEVMERLEQFVQKIYLTKDSGAITIETDGNKYEIRTFLR